MGLSSGYPISRLRVLHPAPTVTALCPNTDFILVTSTYRSNTMWKITPNCQVKQWAIPIHAECRMHIPDVLSVLSGVFQPAPPPIPPALRSVAGTLAIAIQLVSQSPCLWTFRLLSIFHIWLIIPKGRSHHARVLLCWLLIACRIYRPSSVGKPVWSL